MSYWYRMRTLQHFIKGYRLIQDAFGFRINKGHVTWKERFAFPFVFQVKSWNNIQPQYISALKSKSNAVIFINKHKHLHSHRKHVLIQWEISHHASSNRKCWPFTEPQKDKMNSNHRFTRIHLFEYGIVSMVTIHSHGLVQQTHNLSLIINVFFVFAN